MTFRRSLPALAAASLLAVVAAGCGGSSSSSGTTATTGASGQGTALKVGLVTDIGGLNDRSFNHLANLGLQKAEKDMGVQGRVLTSSSNSDYVPNLTTLARQKYDLVIGVGFLMADAIETVAKRFPDVNFAIIDYSQAAMKSKPQNVEGLLFREQQAGYLAGYLAGLVEKQGIGPVKPGGSVISSVGGQKIPPVDHYIAGYQAGAKKADPGIKTPNAYSQNFVDQAKCKELALNQIAQGSDIVFQVAGGCGLGALDAAKSKNVWGIGVDADQSYLGPYVLTSAVKKVDVSVLETIKEVKDGEFKGGQDSYFDLENDGVGLGKISSKVPKSIVDEVDKVRADIVSGKIADIPTEPS
jgi:basic membrane protein A